MKMTMHTLWNSIKCVLLLFIIFCAGVEIVGLIRDSNSSFLYIVMIIGIIGDIIFGIIHSIRAGISYNKKKYVYYILYQYGWVDFLTSYPIIICYSIPVLISLFSVVNIDDIVVVQTIMLANKQIFMLHALIILRALRIVLLARIIFASYNSMTHYHMNSILRIGAGIITSIISIILIWAYTEDISNFRHSKTERLVPYVHNALLQKNSATIMQRIQFDTTVRAIFFQKQRVYEDEKWNIVVYNPLRFMEYEYFINDTTIIIVTTHEIVKKYAIIIGVYTIVLMIMVLLYYGIYGMYFNEKIAKPVQKMLNVILYCDDTYEQVHEYRHASPVDIDTLSVVYMNIFMNFKNYSFLSKTGYLSDETNTLSE